MDRRDRVRLSKTLAHALRHAPGEYGIELDREGWADLEALLESLRRRRGWKNLDEEDVRALIEASDKRRFEVGGGRIRALYGHSVDEAVERPRETPPETLYHGTSPEAAEEILGSGLEPRGRQYAHLSTDPPTARQVGRRKARRPVILEVEARRAHRAGVAFYRGGDGVWLADRVSGRFITAKRDA